MVFLIEELDGDFVKSYTDSIDVTDFNKYIRENKWLYDRVLDNRCWYSIATLFILLNRFIEIYVSY